MGPFCIPLEPAASNHTIQRPQNIRAEADASRGLFPQWATATAYLTSFGRRAQLGISRNPAKPLKQRADAPSALPKLLLASPGIAATSASTRDGTCSCVHSTLAVASARCIHSHHPPAAKYSRRSRCLPRAFPSVGHCHGLPQEFWKARPTRDFS